MRALVDLGLNDCAIARLTGIPRTTVRDWRRSTRWRAHQGKRNGALEAGSCARCGHPAHAFHEFGSRYAYLLGLYLGDGHPGPARHVRVGGQQLEAVPCLLPQHGPGKKHERLIELTDWQQRVVNAHAKQFLRGLIHSDGCRFINRIRHGNKVYEYPRYNFTNRSDDIRRIFCDTCDLLGVEWRVMNAMNISVAKRASVARLDEFIGPKA